MAVVALYNSCILSAVFSAAIALVCGLTADMQLDNEGEAVD